jgi:HAD superfamily phosphatase (TIGR01668 family)
MKLLKPDLEIHSLSDIDIDYYFDKGVRCILTDLDNTIALWRRTSLTDEALGFIAEAKEKSITVIIFTNAKEDRAKETAWNAGLAYYALARKPFTFNYKRAFSELGYDKTQVMAVGDQVFTDVLGGNLAGCVTVLTSPLSETEFWGTKILRLAEKFVAHRNLSYQEGGE